MTLKSTKSSAKTALSKSPLNSQKVKVPTKKNASNRHSQIEKEAYYLAEKASFQGDSLAYWLQAESSINKNIALK